MQIPPFTSTGPICLRRIPPPVWIGPKARHVDPRTFVVLALSGESRAQQTIGPWYTLSQKPICFQRVNPIEFAQKPIFFLAELTFPQHKWIRKL